MIRRPRKPEKHGITIDGKFMRLRSLICDHCNRPIKDGEPVIAVTHWRPAREPEPGPWEELYGA